MSCPEFGGYTCRMCVNDIDTVQQIIDHVVQELRRNLVDLNLEVLYKRLDEMKHLYHVHDYTITDIIINDRDYYICKSGPFCSGVSVERKN